MKSFTGQVVFVLGITALLLPACSTPTLVEIARRRQAPADVSDRAKDDVRIQYHVTDLDVLNFTDEVKRKLANRCSFRAGIRYGSATTQVTLGALAGAAKTIGWGVSTASGLGLGATYIFGLGQIFDLKGQAQAYEQSFTAIQAAEATYYFHQLGMGFRSNPDTGRVMVVPGNPSGRSDIPSSDCLTPDGETLYYRVSKILKVLEDTLAGKIPDLQDLKESKGDTVGSTAPEKPDAASPAPVTDPSPGSRPRPPRPHPTHTPTPDPTQQPVNVSAMPTVVEGTPGAVSDPLHYRYKMVAPNVWVLQMKTPDHGWRTVTTPSSQGTSTTPSPENPTTGQSPAHPGSPTGAATPGDSPAAPPEVFRGPVPPPLNDPESERYLMISPGLYRLQHKGADGKWH